MEYVSRNSTQSVKKPWWNRGWKYILGILILAIVVNVAIRLVIRTYIFRAYKLPSVSMQPSLFPGDCVIVDKRPATLQSIKRKDIVVFLFPEDLSKKFVKRIIGLPGDLIEMKEKQLYINGSPFREDYIVHNDKIIKPYRDNYGPAIVPDGSFFLLGDNRDFSYDSRMFGFIDAKTIEGMVKWIYWSWDKKNSSVRFNRIGKAVN